MERQTKTKKGEEEKDEQKEEQEDIERTSRELFPTTPSAYKTFYTKEHSKGKEPRWKPQQANIEERSMQAKTPHTAKKETASSNEATDLSKPLTEQIREAQETMAKMQAAMENNSQPPFVQEMQQHILNLQQSMKEVQQHTEDLAMTSVMSTSWPNTSTTLFTASNREKQPSKRGKRMAATLYRWGAWQRHQLVCAKSWSRRTLQHNTWQIRARPIPRITSYHHSLEQCMGKAATWGIHLQALQQTIPGDNLGCQQQDRICEKAPCTDL